MNGITKTLRLPYCWVCRNTDSLEEHHVVPRAYGGERGPTVTLCAVCHGQVHNGGSDNHSIAYLAEVIAKAKALTKGDPNKTAVIQARLDGETLSKLKAIKVRLGLKSQVEAIEAAINLTFRQL